jgi:hypothetical protein
MEEQYLKEENKSLSASKIKVFEDCSWLYYCKYHLNLPDTSNLGAQMGSACHLIFEMLLNPRHLKNYKRIIKAKSIDGDKGCSRLIKKHLIKQSINEPKNYMLIDQMILVGLKNDFFVKGGELLGAEYEFNIKNESPNYYIKGFIDKPYKVGREIIIDDFKSSKSKFEGEDRESNIQGMMYSLAAKKIWGDIDPKVRFIFLRFADDPMVKLNFNNDTLKGFEYYLESVQQKINSFTEEDAKKNYAFDQINVEGFKGKLMCGFSKVRGEKKKDGTPKWSCQYKFPFKYFVLKDKDGKTLKSSHENNFKPKEDQKVLELQYTGCPRHRPPIDDF